MALRYLSRVKPDSHAYSLVRLEIGWVRTLHTASAVPISPDVPLSSQLTLFTPSVAPNDPQHSPSTFDRVQALELLGRHHATASALERSDAAAGPEEQAQVQAQSSAAGTSTGGVVHKTRAVVSRYPQPLQP